MHSYEQIGIRLHYYSSWIMKYMIFEMHDQIINAQFELDFDWYIEFGVLNDRMCVVWYW